MDSADEFRERLARARGVGEVGVVSAALADLGIRGDSRGAAKAGDALARTAGLTALGELWRAISRAEARAAVMAMLRRDLAYSSERMTAADTESFADEFLGWLGPDAEFLTNGVFPPYDPSHPAGWRGSWDPLSNATFDVGVFGMNGSAAMLLWVEDED